MTALVSLLFITMIPIDCKIKIFSYACLFIFLVTIIILVNSCTSATSKEIRIILLWVPHPSVNENLNVSKLCIRVF